MSWSTETSPVFQKALADMEALGEKWKAERLKKEAEMLVLDTARRYVSKYPVSKCAADVFRSLMARGDFQMNAQEVA